MLLLKSTFISLAIYYVSSQSCEYGGWTKVNGTCMFNCEYEDRYVPISSVSFDVILYACDRISYTNINYPTDCNSLEDLVYRTDECYCPYCKCSEENEEGTNLEYVLYEPLKDCTFCTCSSKLSSYGINDLVYECEFVDQTSDPNYWEDFVCPPIECEASINGVDTRKESLEYWWEDVGDSDTKCEKFCYCSGKDGKICETGYDDIIENEMTYNAFSDGCWSDVEACYDIETGSYDISRMFTTDSGPSCGSSNGECIVKCDCDGRDIGDKWYHESIDFSVYSDVEWSRCIECECKSDSDGNNYADCDNLYSFNPDVESCPSDTLTTYQCHSDFSTEFANVSSTPRAVNCTSVSDVNYCSWYVDEDQDDGTLSDYHWSCQGWDRFCEAFYDGECAYIDVVVTGEDCDGETYEMNLGKQYTKCCTGNDCNYEDIDISTCSQSIEFQNLYENFYECLHGDSDAAYLSIVCNQGQDEINCDELLDLYEHEAGCQCEYLSGVYDKLSDTSKIIAQGDADMEFNEYSQWNDVFGCNIDLSCDLETGKINGNPGASNGYAVILGSVVLSVCYTVY